MKNLIIIGILILSILSCKAQIIIPVEEDIHYSINEIYVPDGSKIKDINNVLNEYVGTWIGTYDTKTYEFRIVKYTYQTPDVQAQIIEKDGLLLRYKITDNNTGAIIEDTTLLPDGNLFVVDGNYLNKYGTTYVLSYFGKEFKCGQAGSIYISVINSLTEMSAFLAPAHDTRDPADCPNDVIQIFPTSKMILTKQ